MIPTSLPHVTPTGWGADGAGAGAGLCREPTGRGYVGRRRGGGGAVWGADWAGAGLCGEPTGQGCVGSLWGGAGLWGEPMGWGGGGAVGRVVSGWVGVSLR